MLIVGCKLVHDFSTVMLAMRVHSVALAVLLPMDSSYFSAVVIEARAMELHL